MHHGPLLNHEPGCGGRAATRRRDVGVVWFDAHTDFHTEATTPSATSGGCRWHCWPESVC
ncbi:MAG: arginase family protein [Acidimicrobiales bacterium]